MQMFHQIQDDERFLDSVIFSDESTFHVSGTTAGSWAAKTRGVSLDHVRDSPKVNVFCALSKERMYGPFFMEMTITSMV
jgi:hypothetical protein